ncbi:MAG: C-terminal binding protein [Holophaga sp.]|jgi:phosphoglycerate dehydrogenase-like enzyme
MAPFIWIIDEEWPDYGVEKGMLEALYPDCVIRYSKYDYQKDLETYASLADVIMAQIYTRITSDVIKKLLKCKGIAIYGGGYDRVDIKAAREMGISVTNVSDYCKEDVADYVMAGILHFNKKILNYSHCMNKGIWGAQAVQSPVRRIQGSALLIIGLGRIGRVVAVKGKGLGMKVLAYDPYVDAKTMAQLGVEKTSWATGLNCADFISINAILNEETLGMIKYEDFLIMKRSAYLINSARGKIIVEQDLVKAIKEGLISGALVDVIENEPPAMNEDIFRHDNIIVTPHISYISQESYADLKTRTVENAVSMLEGRRPKDLVN